MSKKISLIGAGQIGGTLAHLIGLKELVDEVIRNKNIRRENIVLFLDNATAHTSNYAMHNLY